jgi:hypothetical protein
MLFLVFDTARYRTGYRSVLYGIIENILEDHADKSRICYAGRSTIKISGEKQFYVLCYP